MRELSEQRQAAASSASSGLHPNMHSMIMCSSSTRPHAFSLLGPAFFAPAARCPSAGAHTHSCTASGTAPVPAGPPRRGCRMRWSPPRRAPRRCGSRSAGTARARQARRRSPRRRRAAAAARAAGTALWRAPRQQRQHLLRRAPRLGRARSGHLRPRAPARPGCRKSAAAWSRRRRPACSAPHRHGRRS